MSELELLEPESSEWSVLLADWCVIQEQSVLSVRAASGVIARSGNRSCSVVLVSLVVMVSDPRADG